MKSTMIRFIRVGLMLTVIATAAPWLIARAAGSGDVKLAVGSSFVDRFTSLDRGRWFVSHGWSNGDYQDCTFLADNVALVPGGGVSVTLKDAKGLERPSSCAELQTHATYGYGTYEVRVRAVRANGLVTAFFTYTGPGQASGRPHDEIDFEFLGKNAGGVQLNYFAGGVGNHGHDIDLGFAPSEVTADYAFEWTPEAIRWFVNGREVHSVGRKAGEPFPTHPGKICLSIWNGRGGDMKNWLGAFERTGKPLVAHFERVAFTRLGERCQFPESLVCRRDRPQ